MARALAWQARGGRFESGILHEHVKAADEAAFSVCRDLKGQKRDRFLMPLLTMKPATPKLNTSNPKKWFIYFNIDVPTQLLHKFKTKRVRVKKYDDINRIEGDERLKYANERLQVWKIAIKNNLYNHFEKELNELNSVESQINEVKQEIDLQREKNSRNLISVTNALDLFIKDRESRTENKKSISMWKATATWFIEYLRSIESLDILITEVTRNHISQSLRTCKITRKWSNVTYNNQCTYLMTIFNWFETEELIFKNPAKGKIERLKTKTSINRWYDRELASKVKLKMYNECRPVYYAAAFTYYLAVRSQQEIMKLKVGDLDFTLGRLRFRKEVSKNGREAFREWPEEFNEVIKEMKLSTYPKDYFVFGKLGLPGPNRIGVNWLANQYRIIKDGLGLNVEYTLYSWKHTRVVHEMMKGTDPYEIQYLCRHSSLEETQHYMRGFDLTLRNVYQKEDLTFYI